MVQYKAVGATFSMDYKHSGDLEADGQGKGTKNLISLGNLERAEREKRMAASWGMGSVGKQTLY